ncbi:MAG: glycosyltransferase family 61 protein [Microscillaceae bacterium]|nr:glycosyltransferase family 61 protein [Microscillaceae bacterium]MDW8460867.1 glycosyltransferase family 61 protein [Cytophagales bacterium]
MALVKIICPPHVSLRNKPKNLHPNDEKLFEIEFSKEIPATVFLKLSCVFVIKDTIFNPKRLHFYLKYTHLQKLPKKSLLKRLFIFLSRKSEKQLSKAIWITDEWSHSYFHWLTDALPRLIAVEFEEKNSQSYTVLLPKRFEKYPYVQQSLQWLGYQFYFFSQKVFIKELLLPSHTAPTGNYNHFVINKLREKFLANRKSTLHRKVYISRAKAHKRKILNEQAVIEILQNYGYEIHFFEDYSLEKQIEIMSQTKFLISIHGAGLTNMLFMPQGGQILELRTENDMHNNCYFSLASDLGHDYYYQLNKSCAKDTQNSDIQVDIEILKKNLETIHL